MQFRIKEFLSLCAVVIVLGTACRQASQAQENKTVQPTKTPVETAQKCQPPPLPLANDEPAQTIWNGTSGNFKIDWTTNDLTAKANGADFSIAQYAVQKAIEENGAPEKWFCDHETYSKSYELLSVVGALASFEETDSYSPPTYLTIKYRTVDLSDAARQVSLADLFPATEIVQQLLKNPLIKTSVTMRQKAVSASTKTKTATRANLDEFFKLFECLPDEKFDEAKNCGSIELNDAPENASGASRIFINRNFLEGFAFKRVTGNSVAVEIRLPALTGNRSEEGVPVELLLKIPAALKDDLAKAGKKQAGFLMKDKNSVWKKDADGEFLTTNIFLVGSN